jgi:hypothetical protein
MTDAMAQAMMPFAKIRTTSFTSPYPTLSTIHFLTRKSLHGKAIHAQGEKRHGDKID